VCAPGPHSLTSGSAASSFASHALEDRHTVVRQVRPQDEGRLRGERQSHRTVLRAEPKTREYKQGVRVVETRCSGICPRRVVTGLNAGRVGRILTVPKGIVADEALAHLVEVERKPPVAVAP
jgi:hypothetical protein